MNLTLKSVLLLVAVICFILNACGLDGRLIPIGLAFFAGSFLTA